MSIEGKVQEIVSLARWWDSGTNFGSLDARQDNELFQPLPIIDLRSEESFYEKRIDSFTKRQRRIKVVSLPLSDILNGNRSCELPPRSTAFAILVPKECYQKLFSEIKISSEILDFFFATRSKVTGQSRKAWRLEQILLENEATWEIARGLNILSENGECNIFPHVRLWEPDLLVKTELLPTVLHYTKSSTRIGEIWDMGSGAGRDVCFLAEESMSNYIQARNLDPDCHAYPIKFFGIDIHKGSQKICAPLWMRRGVDSCTEAKLIDLKKIETFHSSLLEAKNDVILCYAIRYMNRNLLKYLVSNECALKAGALFAVSYFCKREGDDWPFNHPKEKNVLERFELKNLFQASGNWSILKDDICQDGDHGRTLIQFLAKKL